MTYRELIKMALMELGIYSAIDTVRSEDEDYCLLKFNALLDEFNSRKMGAYVVNSQAFTLTPSQQSYSIGLSANSPDFTITAAYGSTRPVKIERAKLVYTAGTPDYEDELEVINVDSYADIDVPAQSSTAPIRLYYAPTFPNGTLYPWPYPTDTSNQLKLWMRQQLLEIATASLTTDISLPPGYRNALMLSLAEELAGPPFGVPLSEELRMRAARARANVLSLNNKPPAMDNGGTGGSDLTDFYTRNY